LEKNKSLPAVPVGENFVLAILKPLDSLVMKEASVFVAGMAPMHTETGIGLIHATFILITSMPTLHNKRGLCERKISRL
jgi:hypothetical protein